MPTSQFSVDGLTSIITGSSSGIGRTMANRFADEGANVVVCSREQGNVDPVAEEIEEKGGNVLAIECDVTERDQVENLVEATIDEFGALDNLVNNAGASFMANFDNISPNGWSKIVDINLTGTYNCTQIAGEHLKEDGGGTVVNISSVAGVDGSPYMSHYGAAKAAVINFTRTLGWEWSSENVRVNCVAPGFVATEGVKKQMGLELEEVNRGQVKRRIGDTEEISDIVQFLSTPASSFIVGETVIAKGVPDIMESPEA